MKRLFLTLLCLRFLISGVQGQSGDSWKDILSNKKGAVSVFWFPNNPVINQSLDIMDGVENELVEDFFLYLESEYQVQIQVNWVRSQGFSDVLEVVSNSSDGTFGVSSISITELRNQAMNFSPQYFPDISVLVSSGNIPIARSEDQLIKALNGKTAVTIANTTLEQGLLRLKDSLSLDFEFHYVDNGGAIIEKVEELENAFGYSDLPNFLSSLPGSPNVKRQVFYPLKLEGLGMVFPKNSDWQSPVNEYFLSQQFEEKRHSLISKYMGDNVDQLIERISKSAEIGPDEEIAILTEEVELRYQEQLDAALEAQENQRIRNWLSLGVTVFILLAIFLFVWVRLKAKANNLLAAKQQQIEERNRELFQLNKEKNDLIQVLAHDLRGPMSKISGFSSLIAESPNLGNEEKFMLNSIVRSSNDLAEMVGKILDVAAIESGERNLKVETVELKPMISKVVERFQHQAERKKIGLNFNNGIEDLKVMADKIYLAQVVENLVSNAIKFSQPETKVEIFVSNLTERTRVSVKDEGPGFTMEDQAKVFKKYQHLSAKPTAGEPSTGLGLSIIKSYVDMMWGEISFDTEPGKGTTFHVDLRKA